jgi:hypothetical protein
MLTDAAQVLSRLQAYPNLLAHVSPAWVQAAARKRAVTLWHIFFADNEEYVADVLGNIEKTITYLLQAGVVGAAARARGLCSFTKDGFWSSLTELVQGAKLSAGYPLSYLAVKNSRAPDAVLTTPDGPVYVEFTAVHRTWSFNDIGDYIHGKLSTYQHDFTIRVECQSDAIKIPEQVLEDLAARVDAYVRSHSQSLRGRPKRVFRSAAGGVIVNVQRRTAAEPGLATIVPARFVPSPDSHFPRIMTRIEQKAPQVARYRPNVLVIDLTHESSELAPLVLEREWRIYGPKFRVEELPADVDLAILMWQDIYGFTWQNAALPLRNPASPWASSPEADKVIRLVASQPQFLQKRGQA